MLGKGNPGPVSYLRQSVTRLVTDINCTIMLSFGFSAFQIATAIKNDSE